MPYEQNTTDEEVATAGFNQETPDFDQSKVVVDDDDAPKKVEKTAEEVREEAMARGKANNQKGNSFFGSGYLKEPCKWG